MGKIVAIASGKGGVGKTTLTASLGLVMSRKGYKVLLADGDFGMRDLDLAFGVENDILFDAVDVWKKRCFAEDALISLTPNLDFLPASQGQRWEDLGRKGYMRLLKELAKSYDYVIVDAPAGVGRGIDSILRNLNQLLVIVEPYWASLRDAEKLMLYCNEQKFFDYALVINQVTRGKHTEESSITDILSTTPAEILGAILPFTRQLKNSIQTGTVRNLPEDFLYFTLLQPLVDFIVNQEWEEAEIVDNFEKRMAVSNISTSQPNRTRSLSQPNRTRSLQWRSFRRR